MSEPTTVIAEPGKPTIVISRIFDAPRHLVYRAMTVPELVRQWWGPCVSTVTVCEIDLRVGGKYRNVLRFPDGSEHAFYGVYREIVPDQRIVCTRIYDRYPDSPAVETAELVEHGGVTRLTVTLVHASVAARDSHVASGMERGMAETHQRLDQVLGSLARAA
jgi:uncharacterized protein YndB with AHSA1/START domain